MASIFIDWYNEFSNNFDKWENCTTRVLKEILEDSEHEKFNEIAEKLDLLEDGKLVEYWEESVGEYRPMMNYGHILVTTPDDDKILKCALKTGCCVMYNNYTDECFIGLTGGGMDLSQNIALAYVILENWIPEDLIMSVCKQPGFSLCKDEFKWLKAEIIEQSESYKNRFETLKKDWEKIE